MEQSISTTFFRVPDLLTVASEEDAHNIDGPSEFELTFRGIVTEFDEIVMCTNCNYPNCGEDAECSECEESLEGLQRLRFWRLVPDMQDVDISVEPLKRILDDI